MAVKNKNTVSLDLAFFEKERNKYSHLQLDNNFNLLKYIQTIVNHLSENKSLKNIPNYYISKKVFKYKKFNPRFELPSENQYYSLYPRGSIALDILIFYNLLYNFDPIYFNTKRNFGVKLLSKNYQRDKKVTNKIPLTVKDKKDFVSLKDLIVDYIIEFD